MTYQQSAGIPASNPSSMVLGIALPWLSNGICIVVQAHLSLKKRGGNLKLITPRGQVRDTLMVLHLLEIIPTFEDEAQALASFKQSPTPN